MVTGYAQTVTRLPFPTPYTVDPDDLFTRCRGPRDDDPPPPAMHERSGRTTILLLHMNEEGDDDPL